MDAAKQTKGISLGASRDAPTVSTRATVASIATLASMSSARGARSTQRAGGRTGSSSSSGRARRFAGVLALAGAIGLIGLPALSAEAVGQVVSEAPSQGEQSTRVRVYLDCQGRGCNSDDFRTEITYVDWVRERTAADVHVIMTNQSAGAGTEYVIDYIGQSGFSGIEDQLRHTVPDTDTDDERVRALTRVMAAGLVRYVAQRGMADVLEITADVAGGGSDGESDTVAPEQDPWNYWTFRVGLDSDVEGEERENERNFEIDLSANRTTAEWKVDIGLGLDTRRREVELNDGRVFEDYTDDWDFSILTVRSVSPHWSTGMQFDGNSSTRTNRDLGSRSAAALEWNLFPYEEANRRQFIVHYQLGFSHVRYQERTIFDKLEENLGDQRIALNYNTREPWGNISLSTSYSNYLHDFGKYSASFGGRVSFRVFRGLELNFDGGYDIIRDQLYLPGEDLSDEEILVQRRELATGYEYEFGIGISYRFGSIYNNIVNNRFPWDVRGGGGGGGGDWN